MYTKNHAIVRYNFCATSISELQTATDKTF